MAFEISNGTTVPHATSHSDLLDKLVTFLTVTNTDWTLQADNRGSTGDVVLKGLGLGGTDDIFVGIKTYTWVAGDIFGWFLQGYTGYTGAGFLNEPGAMGGAVPVLNLWNSTIPYWFFANGRRFIVVAKVNNVYTSMYAGHILPYGSSGQWFYPLAIGGSNISNTAADFLTRYSDTTSSMACPFIPAGNSVASNLVIRAASGVWVRLYNGTATFMPPGGSSGFDQKITGHGVFPYNQQQSNYANWFYCRPNQAGNYPLLPLRLCRADTPDLLGIFDGALFTSGFGITSEDIVQYGGSDYLAFQDVFRTTQGSFFAVKKA